MRSIYNKNASWIILLLCTISLLLCLNSYATAEDTQCGYLEITGCGSGFIYSDEMLQKNQYQLSTDLAKASMVLSRGAYSSEAATMLRAMGYEASPYNYGGEALSDDLVAFTIGYRDIPGSNTRLICVVVRGTRGTSEWISNFKFATNNGVHIGFQRAADNVSSTLSNYLNGGKDIILWFTGHSRGAAVANILAARYSNQYKTFGYTYACPAVGTSISNSSNIWNFNNSRDLVPKVPPASWGYQRNGNDYTVYWPSTDPSGHDN